jgi:hypothetical protein
LLYFLFLLLPDTGASFAEEDETRLHHDERRLGNAGG